MSLEKRWIQPLRDWTPTDQDINFLHPTENATVDDTLYAMLPTWLQNWRVNYETIGFDKTVKDLPKIDGPALLVDNSTAGSLDKHIDALKGFKGTILCCDRAAWKLCKHEIIPNIVCNVDSSFLCIEFIDNPYVRPYMDRINGVFSSMSNPLTIRSFSGKRFFFQGSLDRVLTVTLSLKGDLPVLNPGGCVHNTLWVLAYNLKANPIGVIGINNSYEKLEETEFPIAEHEAVKNEYGRFWVDPVYRYYNKWLLKVAKFAKEKHGVRTVNCQKGGILYGDGVEDMSLQEFLKE